MYKRQEFLPHIFDSFSRERNTTLGGVVGTGLGMSIVKSLVDLMEGTIEVESKTGEGSRFTVILQHKLADEEYYEKRKIADVKTDMNFSGKHILLTEDNDLNAEIATAMLEDMGFVVDRAKDGVICINRIEHMPSGTYDLILMDIQLSLIHIFSRMLGAKRTKECEEMVTTGFVYSLIGGILITVFGYLFLEPFAAVSYTHLDVYKRQMYYTVRCVKFATFGTSACFQ